MLGGDFGVRGEVFVVAIGGSSCGDTSKGVFVKKVGIGNEKAATGLPSSSNYDSTLTY